VAGADIGNCLLDYEVILPRKMIVKQFSIEQAMKAQRRSRCIALLFL
jgi:hypothetical protein